MERKRFPLNFYNGIHFYRGRGGREGGTFKTILFRRRDILFMKNVI